jgi:hypothetical protein
MYDNNGDKNVAAGVYALAANQGFNNVGLGYYALRNNTSGSWNAGIGSSALYNNTTGVGNIAIGISSMYNNDTGSSNVAVGIYSLSNTKTDAGTGIGARALSANTSGKENTAVGADALGDNTTGGFNTAIGRNAGLGNFTGNYNTFLGYNAGVSSVRINATAVGYAAYAECSNCMVLGSVDGKNGSNVTVKVGVGTTAPTERFQVGNAGDGSVARANAWQTFSDERYKTQIVTIDHALEKLDQVGGYYYHWKNAEDQSRQAGLIAQEVEKVLPEIVQTDDAGYKSVDYGKMNALLIEAIKEQQVLLKQMQQRITALEKRKK